jgi:uncharacterized membrane protein
MLAVAGEFVPRFLFQFRFVARRLTTAIRRILTTIVAVGIGSKGGFFGVLCLFDHLFAFLYLRSESGLGGCLGVCGGLLRSANLGRVLRRG